MNAVKARHGELFCTWTDGTRTSAIDHVLVSRCLAAGDGITAAGVCQGTAIATSDHRAVVVAVNVEPWFKVTLTTARLRKPKTRTQPARVQLPGAAKPHLEAKLLKYQEAVIKGWRTMKIQERLEKLEEEVALWEVEGGFFGQDDPGLMSLMDSVMKAAIGVLGSATKEVYGKGCRD